MDAAPRTESGRLTRRRRRRARGTSKRELAGAVALGITLIGSALAFGAQHTGTIVAFSLTAAAAALLVPPERAPKLVWLLGGLAAYTLLQIVPLPLAWVEKLSPASGAVWRGALAAFRQVPAYATLSVDPAATALEALKWSAYVCVALAAAGWRARSDRTRLAALVCASALVVCVVTLAHGVLDIERVYGTYQPFESWRWTRGPFINGNNLAGHLNLGLFAGAGIWLARRGETRARWAASVLPVLAVGTLLSGSRAGVVALVVGMLVFAALALRQTPAARGPVTLGLAAASLAALVLSVAAGGGRVWEVANAPDLGPKARGWRWTLDLIRDFPVFGAGRGAFETAFLPYRQAVDRNYDMIYAQAENFVVQWIADWGVGGALGLLGLGYICWRPLRRAWRDPIAAGLVVGLFALALQNLADLGLELFAIMAAAVVAFAGADDGPDKPSERWPKLALPGAVAVALLSGAVLAWGANPVQIDRRAARDDYARLKQPSAPEGKAFDRRLRDLMLRHPGEAYFPELAGLRALALGRDPLPALGRALERSPLDAQLHLALAQALEARGSRSQAALHRRLAAVYDYSLRDHALNQIAGHVDDAVELAAAFPPGIQGSELLADLCDRLRPALVVGCWREVVSRQSIAANELGLAQAVLGALESGAPPCAPAQREACEREIGKLLDHAVPNAQASKYAELRARFLAARGEHASAAKALLEHCPSGRDGVSCHDRALRLAVEAKDLTTLGLVANRYAAVACGDSTECGELHEHIGRAFLELSAPGFALREFTEAAKLAPNAERWLLAASAAQQANTPGAARRALALAQREPLTAAQNARIVSLEQALAKSAE